MNIFRWGLVIVFILMGIGAYFIYKPLHQLKPSTFSQELELPSIFRAQNIFNQASPREIPFRVYQIDSISPKNIHISIYPFNDLLKILASMKPALVRQEMESHVDPSLNLQDTGLPLEVTGILKLKNKTELKEGFLKSLKKKSNLQLEFFTNSNHEEPETLTLHSHLKLDWKDAHIKKITTLFKSSPYITSTLTALVGEVTATTFQDEISDWVEIPLTLEHWAIGYGVPKQIERMIDLENQLSYQYLNQLTQKKSTPKKMDVSIPQIQATYTESLKNWLILSGFEPWTKNLTEAFTKPLSTRGLNDLLLTEQFEVSTIEDPRAPKIKYADFQISSPFIYYVRNTRTNQFYTLGRFYSPTLEKSPTASTPAHP